MAKITFEDKVALNPQPSVANINKVSDADMNEIKASVNDNCTYSTSEVCIGEFLGKPLYRKVFTDTMPQVQTDGTFANKQVDVSALNIDIAIFEMATFIGSPYGEISVNTIPTLSANNLSQGSLIDIYGNYMEIRSNRTIWNTFTYYVSLLYTKTTD